MMTVHPIAALFPLLEGEELAAFAEDIRKNKLREPIKRWNGKIIDGRNRLKACDLTGIEPRFEELTFASEQEVTNYIVSLNLRRRHLDTSQRAMIAAQIANMPEGRPWDNCSNLSSNVSQAEAAQLMNVSRTSVQTAKQVLDSGDQETIERVKSGKESVHKAASKTKVARRSTSATRASVNADIFGSANNLDSGGQVGTIWRTIDHEIEPVSYTKTPEERAAWTVAWDVFDDIKRLLTWIGNADPKAVAVNLKADDADEVGDDEHWARREALSSAKLCLQWFTDFVEALHQTIPAAAQADEPVEVPQPAAAPEPPSSMPDAAPETPSDPAPDDAALDQLALDRVDAAHPETLQRIANGIAKDGLTSTAKAELYTLAKALSEHEPLPTRPILVNKVRERLTAKVLELAGQAKEAAAA